MHQSRFGLIQKNAPYSSLPTLRILFNRVEVATSSEDLAINFQFVISAESKSEVLKTPLYQPYRRKHLYQAIGFFVLLRYKADFDPTKEKT